jgi:hypothetical protein
MPPLSRRSFLALAPLVLTAAGPISYLTPDPT